jgi:hypothetical protein
MDTTGFLPHFTLAGDIQTGMLAILKEGQSNGTD